MTDQEKCPLHQRHGTQNEGAARPKEGARVEDGEKTKSSDSRNSIVFSTGKKTVIRPGTAQMPKKPRRESRIELHHILRSHSSSRGK
jgi:hypothetical protein